MPHTLGRQHLINKQDVHNIGKQFNVDGITSDSDSVHAGVQELQSGDYDFQLTTLVVINEFGEGIPVAYMISNRETGAVIETFYECIKSKVGILEPPVFMSNDVPQYFTLWQRVSVKVSVLKCCCVAGIQTKIGGKQ